MTIGLESLPLTPIFPDGSGQWALKRPLFPPPPSSPPAFLNLLNQPSKPLWRERTSSPRYNDLICRAPFQSKSVRQGRSRHDSNTMHGHTHTGSEGERGRLLHVHHMPRRRSILAIIQVTIGAGLSPLIHTLLSSPSQNPTIKGGEGEGRGCICERGRREQSTGACRYMKCVNMCVKWIEMGVKVHLFAGGCICTSLCMPVCVCVCMRMSEFPLCACAADALYSSFLFLECVRVHLCDCVWGVYVWRLLSEWHHPTPSLLQPQRISGAAPVSNENKWEAVTATAWVPL